MLGHRMNVRSAPEPWTAVTERAMARSVWAVGDIHGARTRLVELLGQAGIIGEAQQWAAGASVGVCLGDYFNRGEDGAGVVALLRRLQDEARLANGRLIPLLGNHDILMRGVLAERRVTPYGEVAARWLLNGGRFLDLEALERDSTAQAWLTDLPAMLLLDGTLYLHSDTLAYLDLGQSVAEVNATVHDILACGDLAQIAELFDLMSRRGELRDPANVDRLLERFGGERLVHGHSPVFGHEPAVSHGGRCINVDGGLWDSDEADRLGFIYWIS